MLRRLVGAGSGGVTALLRTSASVRERIRLRGNGNYFCKVSNEIQHLPPVKVSLKFPFIIFGS